MNKKLARSGPRVRVTKPLVKPRIYPENLVLIPHPGEILTQDSSYIYTCQYCRLKFTQNSTFFKHMSTNHEVQQKQATFQCNDCKIVFTKKSNLDLHCQTNHQLKSKSRCESCAITFKSRYCLRRHLKLKQLLKENSCKKCQKRFTTKEGLSKHVRNKHMSKSATFKCDFCLLNFKVKNSLFTHLKRIHTKL